MSVTPLRPCRESEHRGSAVRHDRVAVPYGGVGVVVDVAPARPLRSPGAGDRRRRVAASAEVRVVSGQWVAPHVAAQLVKSRWLDQSRR